MEAKRAEKERVRDDLFEQVMSPANVTDAWKRVKANGGAAGVDGMEIGDFPDFARRHWETIAAKLREETYKPSPVRRVLIPKGRGRFRPLGIPTVLDRVIQQAIAQVLGELHDPTFSEHSYGFRPGRSAHQAIEAMRGMSLRKGYEGRRCHVVDCDLETFFDTVNHQKMMARLRESVADERLLDLIGKFLKAGAILPDGTYEESRSGVPQGGPLSPLLANILLDELDKELERRGHAFVRYADDFVILCHGPRAAARVLTSITRWLSRRLRLTVNETKSKMVPLAEAAFLGFRILRKKVRWTDRSRNKLKERVRAITKRTRGVSPQQVMADLQRYLRGAVNYYACGIPYRDIVELDGWLRRRMRLYYWKQWGRPRTRRRKLLALGIDRDEVHMASRSRKGHWRMSRNSLVHRAMTDAWLHTQGLPDLVKQWVAIRYPNGPKGTAKMA
jgi:RNA-directed DNA polymerase